MLPLVRRRSRSSILWAVDLPTGKRLIWPMPFGGYRSGRDGEALQIAGVVGQHSQAVVGDEDGVGVAEAAEVGGVETGLDGEDHAGPKLGLVADVQERPLVVAQADGVAGVVL